MSTPLTPLQMEFYRWSNRRFRDNPKGLPKELAHLTREKLTEAHREAELLDSMPDAELLPWLIPLRDQQRAMVLAQWSTYAALGSTLLAAEARGADRAEFIATHAPNLTPEHIAWAMRAAETTAAAV